MHRSIIAVLLLVAACSEKELTPREFSEYLQNEDNGVIKKAEVNNITTSITFQPTDLWVMREVKNKETTPQLLDSIKKKYDAYYYFLVSFSKDGKEALHSAPGSLNEYSDLVQTLSFRMSEFATLTTSKNDTIPVSDFILDRSYGMSSSTAVLFVFANEKARDAEWVQFNLNEFGLRSGNQRFRFLTKDFNRIPKLKYAPNGSR